MSRMLLCAAMLVVSSCKSPEAATQILILVDADRGVTERATSVRVTLQGRRSGDLSDPQFADYGPGGLPLDFPLRVAVVPQGNDATRTLDVAVTGSDADGVFIRADVVTGFVPASTLALRITLTSACIDSTCNLADGETCQPDGTCGPVDGPTLTPLDGGVMDVGPRDAGVDASDTNVPDATMDGGCVVDGSRCSEDGTLLITCDMGVATTETCTCAEVAGESACQPVPRNVTDEIALRFDAPADFATEVGDAVEFDVDDGSIRVNGVPVRAGAGGLSNDIYFASRTVGETLETVAIWGFRTLTLRGAVEFVGGRPAIVLASGDIDIEGRVDLSAAGRVGRLGGQDGVAGLDGLLAGVGGLASTPINNQGTGAAGGAGGRSAGGDGGADSVRGAGGGGDVLSTMGQPLVGGGSGGGSSLLQGGAVVARSTGGGGGGAIQFFSRTTIRVAEGGVIAAHGGGGTSVRNTGGAGGGAGGMVLLEAPDIIVDGGIFVNGGSGASGTYEDEPGNNGRNGQDGSVPAAGADPIVSARTAGRGGDGGAADVPPTNGDAAPPRINGTSVHGAGGGGGSAGFIFVAGERVTTPSGATVLDLLFD
ncbi:MAG: hypothetical protein AB8H86_24790 [Polyangiales bacterium]